MPDVHASLEARNSEVYLWLMRRIFRNYAMRRSVLWSFDQNQIEMTPTKSKSATVVAFAT
ncbi:hypothetical protein ASC90_02180 [Rhizobium sp. Root1220]|nr:hypothetical protein ASC90_02180 [Rhizobium sp. Root1220]